MLMYILYKIGCGMIALVIISAISTLVLSFTYLGRTDEPEYYNKSFTKKIGRFAVISVIVFVISLVFYNILPNKDDLNKCYPELILQ